MTDNDSINQVLAENLAYWMGQAKLTQTALAAKAGLSQKTISNYLNPQQRVEGDKGKEPSAKLTELSRVADALEIGVWQLVRRMSPRERDLYVAIEKQYDSIRKDAEEQAARAQAQAEARIREAAEVPIKKQPVQKSVRAKK